jgi:hypothetical protein
MCGLGLVSSHIGLTGSKSVTGWSSTPVIAGDSVSDTPGMLACVYSNEGTTLSNIGVAPALSGRRSVIADDELRRNTAVGG